MYADRENKPHRVSVNEPMYSWYVKIETKDFFAFEL